MHQTDKEQLIEYLKIVGFEQTTNGCEGTTGKVHYKLEDNKIIIIEYIYNEKDFARRIITEIEGYIGILTYLKINFPV